MHFDDIERVPDFFLICPWFVAPCDKAIDCQLRFFHDRRHWASSFCERLFVPADWRGAPLTLLHVIVNKSSLAFKCSLRPADVAHTSVACRAYIESVYIIG